MKNLYRFSQKTQEGFWRITSKYIKNHFKSISKLYVQNLLIFVFIEFQFTRKKLIRYFFVESISKVSLWSFKIERRYLQKLYCFIKWRQKFSTVFSDWTFDHFKTLNSEFWTLLLKTRHWILDRTFDKWFNITFCDKIETSESKWAQIPSPNGWPSHNSENSEFRLTF